MRRLLIFIGLFILLLLAVGFFLRMQRNRPITELTLYGNVDVRQVDLGFRVSGRVISMPYEEGDVVKSGDLVSKLDRQPYEDEVARAIANLESTKASLVNAEQVYQRRQELVGDGSVSQEDFQNAQTARNTSVASLKEAEAALGVALTNLRDTEVFAPTDGTILTRIREPGTVVKAADAVYTVSISSPVWIRAFVTEPQLGLIHPGMEAEIFTDTPNSAVYQGRIGFISPVAEFTPKTVETTQLRTDLVYRIRVVAENPDRGLRQGMPVTVKLKFKQGSDEETR